MQYADRSSAELQQIRQDCYRAHQVHLAQLATIARAFGQDPAGPGVRSTYGPKYRYTEAEIELFLDDYRHYMTVYAARRQVCCTHGTTPFILPGPWLDTLLARYPAAVQHFAQQAQQRENDARQ